MSIYSGRMEVKGVRIFYPEVTLTIDNFVGVSGRGTAWLDIDFPYVCKSMSFNMHVELEENQILGVIVSSLAADSGCSRKFTQFVHHSKPRIRRIFAWQFVGRHYRSLLPGLRDNIQDYRGSKLLW